jgi:hypothetical protein
MRMLSPVLLALCSSVGGNFLFDPNAEDGELQHGASASPPSSPFESVLARPPAVDESHGAIAAASARAARARRYRFAPAPTPSPPTPQPTIYPTPHRVTMSDNGAEDDDDYSKGDAHPRGWTPSHTNAPTPAPTPPPPPPPTPAPAAVVPITLQVPNQPPSAVTATTRAVYHDALAQVLRVAPAQVTALRFGASADAAGGTAVSFTIVPGSSLAQASAQKAAMEDVVDAVQADAGFSFTRALARVITADPTGGGRAPRIAVPVPPEVVKPAAPTPAPAPPTPAPTLELEPPEGGAGGDVFAHTEAEQEGACDPGTMAVHGKSSAAPGTTTTLCSPCAAGKWQGLPNQPKCETCPVCPKEEGAAAAPKGCGGAKRGTCQLCEPGRYRHRVPHTAEVECAPCPPGKFQSSSGGASCTKCAACEEAALTLHGCGGSKPGHCQACGLGTYDAAGKCAPCDICPGGQYSRCGG